MIPRKYLKDFSSLRAEKKVSPCCDRRNGGNGAGGPLVGRLLYLQHQPNGGQQDADFS